MNFKRAKYKCGDILWVGQEITYVPENTGVIETRALLVSFVVQRIEITTDKVLYYDNINQSHREIDVYISQTELEKAITKWKFKN